MIARYILPSWQVIPQIRALIFGVDEKKAVATELLFAALLQLEETFFKSIKGKSFFGGDTINLVDITLGSCLTIEIITGINFLEKKKTPRLVKWTQCFCSAEVVKEVLLNAKNPVEYSKVLFALRRAASAPPSK
ncbi:hypothetical protein IEQ34_015001 [Dendrobium chrysotoxum]|uniref:GST C-terminal domain-containing protein n=1 Tax=Dendrobium chrysotoxum TaxID=161865 RepID=A0AAV7G5C6_DENCH|nr:hypothetical protein IEQ34_015001 [Dendrobium chrysotoxum]